MWTVLLGCFSLLLSIHPSHRCGAETARCPQGWMTSKENCYGIFPEKRRWREAEKDCQARGVRGHLASILDEEDTEHMATFIKASTVKDLGPVWIGMFYDGTISPRADWWWRDAYKIFYYNWMKGSPKVSKNGKFCVYLVENEYKYWKETDCGRWMAYLCKHELKYQRR